MRTFAGGRFEVVVAVVALRQLRAVQARDRITGARPNAFTRGTHRLLTRF